MYVREINDDLNPWWSRWSYGTIHKPELTVDAAYAVGHLSSEEPSYVMVSRPLPRFADHLDLEKQAWGYLLRDRGTEVVIWENHCPASNQIRVLANNQWALNTLEAKSLLWAFDVRVTKERREQARWGYSLFEAREWTARAVVDATGQIRWGPFRQTHHEYNQ